MRVATIILLTLCIRAFGGSDDLRIDSRHSSFRDYVEYFGVKAHEYSTKAAGFAEVKQFIEKHDFKTANAFLEGLKGYKALEGIFATTLLLPLSESSQRKAVSPLFPRILLHKDRLFFGLTGNPAHAALYELLEIIEYVAAEGAFHFHRVAFPGAGSARKATFDEKETSCRDCHGKDSRLVWESYDFWTNTWNSTTQNDEALGAQREKFFKAVQGKEAAYARYRLLGMGEYGPGSIQNQHLFVHAGMINFHRIHKRLTKQLPNYREHLYALVAPFARCDDYTEFFPAKRAQRLAKAHGAETPAKALAALLADSEKSVKDDYLRRIDRFNRLHKTSHKIDGFEQKTPDLANPDILAKLRFLVEGTRIDMRYWSLSFVPGEETHSYHFGIAGSNLFTIYMYARDFLIPDLTRVDAEAAQMLRPLYTPGFEPGTDLRPICAWLKRKSLAALEPLRD